MTEPESHISTAGNQRRPRHSGPFRKIITGISLFFAICLIAVIGYVAAGWKLEDSIYMVIITIFGHSLVNKTPIEIIQLHEKAKQNFQVSISLADR